MRLYKGHVQLLLQGFAADVSSSAISRIRSFVVAVPAFDRLLTSHKAITTTYPFRTRSRYVLAGSAPAASHVGWQSQQQWLSCATSGSGHPAVARHEAGARNDIRKPTGNAPAATTFVSTGATTTTIGNADGQQRHAARGRPSAKWQTAATAIWGRFGERNQRRQWPFEVRQLYHIGREDEWTDIRVVVQLLGPFLCHGLAPTARDAGPVVRNQLGTFRASPERSWHGDGAGEQYERPARPG